MDISIIGTGNMGTAVATGLLNAGHRITVYNRTGEKAQRLGARGAKVADTAAAAIRASEFSIVVLFDATSTREVLLADKTKSALAGRALMSVAAMSPEDITRSTLSGRCSRTIRRSRSPARTTSSPK